MPAGQAATDSFALAGRWPPGIPVLCLQSGEMKQFAQAGIGAVLRQPTGFVFGQARVYLQQSQGKALS